MTERTELWQEQLERLRQMASPDGDWDLSDNDRAAIVAVLKRIGALTENIGELALELNTLQDRVNELRIADLEAALSAERLVVLEQAAIIAQLQGQANQ